MIYRSGSDWLGASAKRVVLFGMSGLGKTFLANMLREAGDWFHYSVDYRIGTRYMGEFIADNFKREAMKVPFLRELLLSDSVYIASNITFDNLAPLSTYLGKPGSETRGGLPFQEYMRRQDQHRMAEIAALLDSGVTELRIANRTRLRAEQIRAEFGPRVVVHDWAGAGAMLVVGAVAVAAESTEAKGWGGAIRRFMRDSLTEAAKLSCSRPKSQVRERDIAPPSPLTSARLGSPPCGSNLKIRPCSITSRPVATPLFSAPSTGPTSTQAAAMPKG